MVEPRKKTWREKNRVSNNERKAERDRRRYWDISGKGDDAGNKLFQNAVDEWTGKMTEDEQRDVGVYTGYKYEDINKYLRDESMGSGEWPSMEEIIKNATSGINKFTLEHDMYVFRRSTSDLLSELGLTFHAGDDANAFVREVQASVGSKVADRGFVSTSVKHINWSGDVRYEIQVPKGTSCAYVDHISHNRGERELLLNRSTEFKIVGARVEKATEWFETDKPVVILRVVGRKNFK